ncbi:gamma-glutamyltransferase [Leptolyngbya sp. 7M]|nr:gamma-glutamyltransferase [Leptolyngbya sp. 7M]
MKRSRFTYALFVLVSLVISAVLLPVSIEARIPAKAKNAMVASQHPLASQIGLDIFRKGGNAVDAAIAVGLALAVVYPEAGNIGGGGFMVIRKAAAHRFLAAVCGQFLPIMIDLCLIFALDRERYSFGEFEKRPAVETNKLLAVQNEINCKSGPNRAARVYCGRLVISCYGADSRIRKDRDVKVRSLFSLAIEPKEWCYLLHKSS